MIKDDVLSWLNDAYSMERSIEQVLENHTKDAADFPEMQGRLRSHLEQTRRHAEMVRECIEELGGSVSQTKALLSNIMGQVKAVSTGMYSDELVKNVLSEYMTEHFEIACYTSLIAAASEIGNEHLLEVCQQILREEEGMAEWVGQQIPIVTRQYLAASAAAA